MSGITQHAISLQEARDIFSRLVAGWAEHLSPSGARLYGEGFHNHDDYLGPYQGVTRMLPAISAWLSDSSRPKMLTWQGKSYNLPELLSRALINGCDPNIYDSWEPETQKINQHTVETWSVSFALWQSRPYTWETYTKQQKENITTYLSNHSLKLPERINNWILFIAINHTVRKRLGQPYDKQLLHEIERQLDSLYIGDGWFDETDDYNWWGFSKLIMAWAMVGDEEFPDKRFLEFVGQGIRDFPYFFSGDGNYARWGRSQSYKFARLIAPLWAYHLGLWDDNVGMLRHLVSGHLRWYLARGVIRTDGLIDKTVTATGSHYALETYSAANAQYWAMMAFAGLWTLSDADPFWSTEEKALPLEQENYTRVLKSAGQIIVGTQKSQIVRRYIGYIRADSGEMYVQKYGKYVYENYFGFIAGNVGINSAPDNMLSLNDGEYFGHRSTNLEVVVDESGWIRMLYEELVRDKRHVIDTVIVPHGEVHLRAHRITLADGVDSLSAIEGASAIGYERVVSALPVTHYDDNHTMIIIEQDSWNGSIGVTGIHSLQGYDRVDVLNSWLGQVDLHILNGRFILPVLKVNAVSHGSELICIVYSGKSTGDAKNLLLNSVIDAGFLPDGTFELTWHDKTRYSIPPLIHKQDLT